MAVTREEIDATLKRIIAETGAVAKNTITQPERMLGACVAMLALIVGEQEQRLLAVEPCPGAPALYEHKAHAWREDGSCSRCEARRTS